MRDETIRFIKKVKELYPEKFKDAKILEVGSLQLPMQEELANLRPHFPECKCYFGIDKTAGKGVDNVADINDDLLTIMPDGNGLWDVVICSDMLEHNKNPIVAVKNMYKCLKSEGVLIITSVMNFAIHEQPDYWRFTPDGFELLLQDFEFIHVEFDGEPQHPRGVQGYGVKG